MSRISVGTVVAFILVHGSQDWHLGVGAAAALGGGGGGGSAQRDTPEDGRLIVCRCGRMTHARAHLDLTAGAGAGAGEKG